MSMHSSHHGLSHLPMIAISGGLPGKERGTDFQSEALKRNFPSRLKGYGLSTVRDMIRWDCCEEVHHANGNSIHQYDTVLR